MDRSAARCGSAGKRLALEAPSLERSIPAILRAELNARYAKLYGLDERELTYILNPSAVYGPDYPSESFRVLKEKELAEFGEYKTMRLVLEAFRKIV